jgi:hypothetical protein
MKLQELKEFKRFRVVILLRNKSVLFLSHCIENYCFPCFYLSFYLSIYAVYFAGALVCRLLRDLFSTISTSFGSREGVS